jgi:hypothetical protein
MWISDDFTTLSIPFAIPLEFRLMLWVVFLLQAISIECATDSVIFDLV